MIYDGQSEVLQRDVPRLQAIDVMPRLARSRVRLSFHTPTQLKADRVLQRGLNFSVLIRARRCPHFHGDGPPNLDYSDWIARAKGVQTAGCDLTWRTWERYSNRKQQRMQISGFTGDVVFEGDLERFGPLLALGLSVHVGKWTSFGMGQYALR